MRSLIKSASFIGLLAMAQIGYASSISDTYNDGDTLTASTLDNIKSAVNDNDQRISNLQASDFSGYGQTFSALGEPKNVIVQVRENSDLTKAYLIRSRYHNNSEQVSVDGVLTTPSLIAHYDWVNVDAAGTVTSISTYIEAPQTENYLVFTIEDATLDINTFAKTINEDNRREDWNCTGGGSIATCNWTSSVSGTLTTRDNWVSTYTSLGLGTINGIAFDDLRAEINTYTTGVRNRVRAKGIGEVLRQDENQPRVAIYYQADGGTGGSLAGTPFESGGALDGVLF